MVVSALRRASDRAGVPMVTGPGIGRHIFGSYALSYGPFTETQVADALGHSAPGVTQRYLHALAVNPLRRPMAKVVEEVLLGALAKVEIPGETGGGSDESCPKVVPRVN